MMEHGILDFLDGRCLVYFGMTVYVFTPSAAAAGSRFSYGLLGIFSGLLHLGSDG
jgi:hypothetical protein